MPSVSDNMDNYKVLDVSRDATAEEIRLAYKKLALKWHPDRHTTDKENAQQKFIEIHEAYRILTEKEERRRAKRSAEDPKSSGSSSTCATADWSTPPSSPPPSTSECHGSESHTTPPSTPDPSTHPSSSRSYSHGSSSSTNNHSSHAHKASPSSSKASHSPDHKSSRNRASDSRASSSDHHAGHAPSPHRTDCEAPSSSKSTSHSSADSKFRSSSSRTGSNDPHSHAPPPTGTHSKSPFHPAEPPSTPKSSRAKLRKQSKPTLRRPDHTTRNPRTAQSVPFSPICGAYPRSAANLKEWRCPTKLTLEELFHGKHLRFRLTRYLLSNKKKHVILDIHVPPGCRPGTKIILPGIGHERKDGSLQDIVFVVEEAPHERFCRLRKNGDDLGMDVKLPWVKALEKEKGAVHIKGIDGKDISVKIDYPNDRHTEGTHVVVGAGMPIRAAGEGKATRRRGDLVVRWEIVTSTSTWEALKHKVLRFKD